MPASNILRALVLALAAVAVGAGVWILRTWDPNVAGGPFPPCMFRAFTGWLCIGCGLTSLEAVLMFIQTCCTRILRRDQEAA